MTPLTIYQNSGFQTTVVSNYFIDEYMPDANAAQIKIYLYLLRVMGAGLSTSVSEMADFLNYPEKDIVRALKYWEKKGILSLDYTTENIPCGVCMLPFPNESRTTLSPKPVSNMPISNVPEAPAKVLETTESEPETLKSEPSVSFTKPSFSLDELKEFKQKDSVSELVFIIETYLNRPLVLSEVEHIYFFIETLKMSDDLIDFLFQYCIGRGKADFHYIEKVAINWAENGVKTPEDAKKFSYKYAKIVYSVMKALGKSTNPTDEEASYVHTWSTDMGFTDDIILEACRRSVTGTDKNRLQYADTILKSWKTNQVISLTDVEKLDEDFKKKKAPAAASKANYKKSSFHQFKQRDYDFDALEKQLLSN